MSRTLRALVVGVTLLIGLFGATTAFASPNPATSASHAVAVSAPAAHTVSAVDNVQAPAAKYQCATTLLPPYITFTYSCVITSGFVQYIAHCVDGSLVTTGWLPIGIQRGSLSCASTILLVAKYTED